MFILSTQRVFFIPVKGKDLLKAINLHISDQNSNRAKLEKANVSRIHRRSEILNFFLDLSSQSRRILEIFILKLDELFMDHGI